MRITSKQYAQALYDLTDGKSKTEIEKIVADFAQYLRKERKLKMADKIIEQFEKIYNLKNGIIEAEIITRKKLDEVLGRKARHFIKEKYGAKEVVLKNIVDESIKGGLVLKVGDEVMDGSAKRKLEELRKILKS